jgi:arylsulfatase
VLAIITSTAVKAADNRPNVVFILADNVGYGDLGPYGGGELRGAPTPRVDQLAREGMRLTQFLVEPTCTPSRAALMTGQYSIRNGLSLISLPDGPNQLSGRAYTMGQLFKDAGYATARRACQPRMVSTSSMASRQTPRGTTRSLSRWS